MQSTGRHYQLGSFPGIRYQKYTASHNETLNYTREHKAHVIPIPPQCQRPDDGQNKRSQGTPRYLKNSKSKNAHNARSNTCKTRLHMTRRIGGVRRAIGRATRTGVVIILGTITIVVLRAAVAGAGLALGTATILVVVTHGAVLVGSTATGLVGAACVRARDAVDATGVFAGAASAWDAGGRRKRGRDPCDQRLGFGDRLEGAQLDGSALGEGRSCCCRHGGEGKGEGNGCETHLGVCLLKWSQRSSVCIRVHRPVMDREDPIPQDGYP